jgi:hypothetical protein
MKTLLSGIITLFAFLATSTPTFADAVCSAGMIQDTYGYVGQAVVDTGQGIMYCGVTGTFKFKANGTATGRIKQSCNGMLETATGEGTYVVRQNCTADAEVSFSDGASAAFHFTLVDGGKTLLFVGDQFLGELGITFTGTARPL